MAQKCIQHAEVPPGMADQAPPFSPELRDRAPLLSPLVFSHPPAVTAIG